MESVGDLQKKMADNTLTSEELVKRSFAVIENNGHLNAFISINQAAAIAQARHLDELRKSGAIKGPLHGIPIAVKDNVHVAGLPNTAGTAALKNFIPDEDAGVIKRLKAAGAIVIGKTNMHELAFGITNDNYTFGAVGNAYNDQYFSGGSSGGTAVAVAKGMAPVGLGTDTGGSSRIPAALNGIVGFRPTVGRYPDDGLTKISSTKDTAGPMALSVSDIALLDGVLSDENSPLESVSLAGLRMGVPRECFFENIEPSIAKAIDELLERLRESGVILVEEDIKGINDLNEKAGLPIVIYEAKKLLASYLKDYVPGVEIEQLFEGITSPDVKSVSEIMMRNDVPESVYQEAMNNYRVKIKQAYSSYFSEHQVSVVLFPTMALTARPIEGSLETVELNGKQVPTFPTYIRNTEPASNAGLPGLSLPLAMSPNGMPIAVEIDGPEQTDRYLLAIGMAIETLINRNNKN